MTKLEQATSALKQSINDILTVEGDPVEKYRALGEGIAKAAEARDLLHFANPEVAASASSTLVALDVDEDAEKDADTDTDTED